MTVLWNVLIYFIYLYFVLWLLFLKTFYFYLFSYIWHFDVLFRRKAVKDKFGLALILQLQQ